MDPVSDGFLLTAAQVAATLMGLLLLGGFFYVETGLRRAETLGAQAGPFLRATIKLTLLLYALVLGVSLGAIVLSPPWFAVGYALLAAAVLRALVDWTLRYRDLRRVVPTPRDSPWVTWPAVVLTLALPWILDGWDPGRQALLWALLPAGGLALWSTAGLLLTSFDLAAWDRAAHGSRGARPATRSDP